MDQRLLLTILTVLAGWTLLGLLAAGLYLILKALQSVRGYLEKIAMGVRAIERQLVPLPSHAEEANAALATAAEAVTTVADRFVEMERLLEAARPALGGR